MFDRVEKENRHDDAWTIDNFHIEITKDSHS